MRADHTVLSLRTGGGGNRGTPFRFLFFRSSPPSSPWRCRCSSLFSLYHGHTLSDHEFHLVHRRLRRF